MEPPDSNEFVEEIDYTELAFQEVVGRGAFGVVSRAEWRGKLVAVKLIETENEKKAFLTELKQLSRVSHPNIVKLYGASRTSPVFLVMEYAEGGSLYNVLHCEGIQPQYLTAHAISWSLQCAKGVEYLHSMKPKPLVHRDLKPPNLLLIAGGTILKICDFGTACDAHTHMTNNKGSAAWMAPEVFEGSNYSEKCDVFSFGIILWEILTRRRPFDEIGGPAFRIMWAVHSGTRPPLIQNCPPPLEQLMVRCWSSNPVERPSFVEVVRVLTAFSRFFKDDEKQPLVYRSVGGEGSSDETQYSSVYDSPPPTNSAGTTQGEVHNTVRQAEIGEPVRVPPSTPITKPVVVEVPVGRRTSAPASLAASHENLMDKSRSSTPSVDANFKRYSADLSKLEEQDYMSSSSKSSGRSVKSHRRSGSYGTPFVSKDNQVAPAGRGHKRTGSHGNSPLSGTPCATPTPGRSQMASTSVDNLLFDRHDNDRNVNFSAVLPNGGISNPVKQDDVTPRELSLALIDMDHQIKPFEPCNSSPESMGIHKQHLELAEKFIRVQTEIALLNQRKHDLSQELKKTDDESQECDLMSEQIGKLDNENKSLEILYKEMQEELSRIRGTENRGLS